MEFVENSGLYTVDDFAKDKIFFTYDKDESFSVAKKKIEDLRHAGASDDRIFLNYSEATLCIPPTSRGLVCRNENGTIICVMLPRSVSLQVLTKKNAINQAVLFKHLIKTLPNQPRGKKTHNAISDEKYVVAGVTALQGSGLSTHELGVLPEHQLKKKLKTNPQSRAEQAEPKTELDDDGSDCEKKERGLGTTLQSHAGREEATVETVEEETTIKEDPVAPTEDPVRVWISGLHYKLFAKLSLLRVARRCEQLARRFIPIAEHRALYEALALVNTPVAQTFWNIYSSCAMGTDFQAAMHTDFDAFFSILIVHSCLKSDKVPLLNRIAANLQRLPAPCHHFIFPTFGLAITLRPGDHFFFNPLFEHGCSAKLPEYQQSNVSLMAFYLKAACVDGHDSNELELTDMQKEMVEEYRNFLAQNKKQK
jgi:hypothetical protein